MGFYLNPRNINFKKALNAEIFADKSQLIAFTNKLINTPGQYLCVSRPRRFGKTMAADMLSAYYNYKLDSSNLFNGLKISTYTSYKEYLNKYHVLKIDMQTFLNKGKTANGLILNLTKKIIEDLEEDFPEIIIKENSDIQSILAKFSVKTNRQIVFIIDEWDYIMRRTGNKDEHKTYLDFLRDLLKD